MAQEVLHSSNFFDLFGFDTDFNFVSRCNIKIYEDFYPEGFVFEKDKKYSGFWIGMMIDEIPLLYIIDQNTIDLKNFVSYGWKIKTYVNVKLEKVLYRYGKKRWIEEAFYRGSFQIKPAIHYLKEDNKARKDNEHKFESTIKKEQNIVITDQYGNSTKAISDAHSTSINTNINQHILCMSYAYDERLYEEFESDACLIIKDPNEFRVRLEKALIKENSFLELIECRVSYSKIQHSLGLLFSKIFEYSIQKEYRFLIWNDKQAIIGDYEKIINDDYEALKGRVKSLQITLGSLEDIAEIVYKI